MPSQQGLIRRQCFPEKHIYFDDQIKVIQRNSTDSDLHSTVSTKFARTDEIDFKPATVFAQY